VTGKKGPHIWTDLAEKRSSEQPGERVSGLSMDEGGVGPLGTEGTPPEGPAVAPEGKKESGGRRRAIKGRSEGGIRKKRQKKPDQKLQVSDG